MAGAPLRTLPLPGPTRLCRNEMGQQQQRFSYYSLNGACLQDRIGRERTPGSSARSSARASSGRTGPQSSSERETRRTQTVGHALDVVRQLQSMAPAWRSSKRYGPRARTPSRWGRWIAFAARSSFRHPGLIVGSVHAEQRGHRTLARPGCPPVPGRRASCARPSALRLKLENGSRILLLLGRRRRLGHWASSAPRRRSG